MENNQYEEANKRLTYLFDKTSIVNALSNSLDNKQLLIHEGVNERFILDEVDCSKFMSLDKLYKIDGLYKDGMSDDAISYISTVYAEGRNYIQPMMLQRRLISIIYDRDEYIELHSCINRLPLIIFLFLNIRSTIDVTRYILNNFVQKSDFLFANEDYNNGNVYIYMIPFNSVCKKDNKYPTFIDMFQIFMNICDNVKLSITPYLDKSTEYAVRQLLKEYLGNDKFVNQIDLSANDVKLLHIIQSALKDIKDIDTVNALINGDIRNIMSLSI